MQSVPDVPENVQRCACPGCPSDPTPEGSLYCARDAAPDEIVHKGCLCPQCPIFKVYGLVDEYFCDAAARDQTVET